MAARALAATLAADGQHPGSTAQAAAAYAHALGPAAVVTSLVLANLLAWALNERSWAFRRLLQPCGCRRMLFISNRSELVSRDARPASYWCLDLLSPLHLVTSPVLGTAALAALHICTFLYWVATLFQASAVEWYGLGCKASDCPSNTKPNLDWLAYVTNLSLCLLGMAGLVAFANTLRFAWRQRRARRGSLRGSGNSNSKTLGAAAQDGGAKQQQQLASSPSWARHAGWQLQPGSPAAAGDGKPATGKAGGAALFIVKVLDRPSSCDSSSSSGSISSSGGSLASQQSCTSSVGLVCDVAGSSDSPAASPRAAKWDVLSVLHLLMMVVAIQAAFVVSFWYLVGRNRIAPDEQSGPSAMLEHAGNLGVAMAQLLLTRLPLASTHFQVELIYATAYVAFLLAVGEGSGVWRYSLNWHKLTRAAPLVVLPLVVFIQFCILFAVALAREAAMARLERWRGRAREAGEGLPL